MGDMRRKQPLDSDQRIDCSRPRLCENLSISVSLKNERTDDRHRGKTIEKTMLRVLGSCTFSHSLARGRSLIGAAGSSWA